MVPAVLLPAAHHRHDHSSGASRARRRLRSLRNQEAEDGEHEKTHSGHTVGSALMSPMVWFQALILVIMTTGERATSAWGGMYLKDVLHLDPAKEGAWFNSCFYLVFTLARLVGGFLVDAIGAFATEYLMMIGSIVIFTVGLAIGKTGVYVLPFAGAFVAFFWPTFIVTCMRYWKEDAAVPISCILPMRRAWEFPSSTCWEC